MPFSVNASQLLVAASTEVGQDAVEDDQEEERESFEAAMDIDNKMATDSVYLVPHEMHSPNKTIKKNSKLMKGSLKKASADVVVSGTQNEYRR